MSLLQSFLEAQRKEMAKYDEGLLLASTFVENNNGQVVQCENNETKLILGNDVAICFKPYDDIDLFYFEL